MDTPLLMIFMNIFEAYRRSPCSSSSFRSYSMQCLPFANKCHPITIRVQQLLQNAYTNPYL